ncbi:hypothetical protein ABEY48_01065 [Bacillus mycoides]|uniref:hypothetical protein n=1 Tax=Bacillus mycoides TaxID=1405 RepID=UPI003D1D9430
MSSIIVSSCDLSLIVLLSFFLFKLCERKELLFRLFVCLIEVNRRSFEVSCALSFLLKKIVDQSKSNRIAIELNRN